jgi:hypothetical protein
MERGELVHLLKALKCLYVSNRICIDTEHNISTNCVEIIQGVKQGRSLLPVLFNVYVNFMIVECKNDIQAMEFIRTERDVSARLCSLVIRY